MPAPTSTLAASMGSVAQACRAFVLKLRRPWCFCYIYYRVLWFSIILCVLPQLRTATRGAIPHLFERLLPPHTSTQPANRWGMTATPHLLEPPRPQMQRNGWGMRAIPHLFEHPRPQPHQSDDGWDEHLS